MRAPIVAIVIMQIAALFARALLEVRLTDRGEPAPFAQDLSYLVVPPILIVLMFPILREHGRFLLSLLRWDDLSGRVIVLSVLLGVSLRMSFWGGLISLVSFGALKNPDPNALVGPLVTFGCPGPGSLALSFFVVSLLIPVTEEVVNRGLILQSLLQRGRVTAIIVSSILFAVMHDPQNIMIAFSIGIILGLQMLNHRTLWAPMIAHATYNAISVLDWECMSAKWNPVETTPTLIAVGLLATALFIAALSLSVLLARHKGHRGAQRPDAGRT